MESLAWPVSLRRRGAVLGGWCWDRERDDEEEEEGVEEVAWQVGRGGEMS